MYVHTTMVEKRSACYNENNNIPPSLDCKFSHMQRPRARERVDKISAILQLESKVETQFPVT